MKPAKHRRAAFTLVELIVTIAIIAGLAGLIMPVVGNLRKRADSIACVSNLRQIGVAGLLFSTDNNQTLPVIEPWPSSPLYPASDGVKSLEEVLGPYGITGKALICRTDISGPDYHSKEGSSYEWCPMANGQNIQAVKLSWGNMPDGITLARLILAFDYANIHGEASNVLFGDGHVAAATP